MIVCKPHECFYFLEEGRELASSRAEGFQEEKTSYKVFYSKLVR